MKARWVLFLLIVATGRAVSADTFTVTNNTDTASPGSLRWAINQANTNLNKDNIWFAIPPFGSTNTPATIQPTGRLPVITAPVTIDGWSQIGGPACQAGITLDGAVMSATIAHGLWLEGVTNSDIMGLCIHRMRECGILIYGGVSNRVYGCFIGTDRVGTNYVGNGGCGIVINTSPHNEIGLRPTTSCTNRNIISGNAQDGVAIVGAGSSRNVVRNNYIGTDFYGQRSIPNDWHGVHLDGNAMLNNVGSSDVGDIKPVNVISGNGTNGVHIGGASPGNQIMGNHIGLSRDGTAAIANAEDGVHIEDSSGNYVGESAGEGMNVISGNLDDGVEIWGTNAAGNYVYGNYIGLASNGLAAIGNGDDGVVMEAGAQQNTVGWYAINARNVISGNRGCGIKLENNAHGNNVYGNYIGLNRDGLAAVTNLEHGVLAYNNAYGNIIGSHIFANSGNYISGNGMTNLYHGVCMLDASDDNRVARNVIGLNVMNLPVGNAGDGVQVRSCTAVIIGGTGGVGNVISANGGNGIRLGSNAVSCAVYGNYIGVDTNASLARPNRDEGILIFQSTGCSIGTNDAGNVISGNRGNGIKLADSPLCHDNWISDNMIGCDYSASFAVANSNCGIIVVNASSNYIGVGRVGNFISGNGTDGVRIEGADAQGNELTANMIGIDGSGMVAMPNVQDGVAVHDAPLNRIGTVVEGNRVGGNGRYGVFLYGSGSWSNRIQNNGIGVGVAGYGVPNGHSGVMIHSGPSGNLVGGTIPAAANEIAYNANMGVQVLGDQATNNAILRNSIHDNASRGIDLWPDFTDVNDDQDPDTGPNQRQNYPVLFSATTGSVTIAGALNSRPHTAFHLEFFLNTNVDLSGHGEGQFFLGYTNLSTGADGNLSNSFLITFPATVTTSQYVSATATDPDGNTSEFSRSVPIVNGDLWDADGDGMPGVWESDRGLDPNDGTGTNGAAGDPDGDTTPNYDEYVADTDPADSNNCFQIVSISDPDAAVVIYSSTNTRYYMAYRGTNLADDAHWEGMYGAPLQGTNGVSGVTDTNSSTFRPYRVSVQISP